MILLVERLYQKIIHNLSILSFGYIDSVMAPIFSFFTVCRNYFCPIRTGVGVEGYFLLNTCGYKLLLLLFILVLSVKITRWILKNIPVKYFNENEINISSKWLYLVYLHLVVSVFLFNHEVILIILLSVFYNLIVSLFIIDIKIGYLPDVLTYPLLWIGLLYQTCASQGNVVSAIYAVVVSYLSIMLITTMVEKIRQSPQMGRGDFKLIAACAAWLGLMDLPKFFALAAGLGCAYYGGVYLFYRHKTITHIPFGPAIIISANYWLFFLLINS
ncbi:A24 family peptidase [Providencia stuartii]|uniref:prepilin peptidase n=1 Tax=Providencia stuartii TaxID=588 RepID=UPI0023E27B73|nr:A24 family peptidase [Providencia stuartii]WER27257.1 A24 family peptidase [Providencia stuartii]WER31348.1 A24 family peptidase [Providencia stuartii]